VPEYNTSLESRIQEAVTAGFRDRLLDMGLARGLIWHNGILPQDAPRFPATLTEDLLDFAYAVIGMALHLRTEPRDSNLLIRAFLVAGEAIEAAIHRGDPERQDLGFHRVNAAVAFHLAQYAARAYSILPSGNTLANLSPAEGALVQLLRRSLNELHRLFSSWLLNEAHQDRTIAERLRTEVEFDEFDAFHDVLTTSFMRSLALIDHALGTGHIPSAVRAKEVLLTGVAAAADFHMVPQWWTMTLTAHLFDELWSNSLHACLPSLPSDHPDVRWNLLRRRYIQRLRYYDRASVELWPSQVIAAKRAVDLADNLVIALPTSAGKTRIAELCILRTLAARKRVVYITPLRALSAQVERDLAGIFEPLGFQISSLYGAPGIERWEFSTLSTYKIVVATPEKVDFALRNKPTVIDDVGLIVLDEGHMLGPKEREVRYEALVQRLLRRGDAGSRRIICLSALFPEAGKMTDFVAWLRRDVPGDPVHSTWRPTRQRYGWIRWEGDAARLEVKVEDEQPYVPRFVEAKRPQESSHRRNDFPQSKNELILAAAWQFAAQDKDVLIYCPRRDSVETLGRLVLKCGKQGILRPLQQVAPVVRDVIIAGREWLGTDHPAVLCLEFGVALHHGGLPRQFLNEVERLLRKGYCRVTIASPTLAQGLNLSASVLLVPSIRRGQEEISPMEFANVAGRAGRAFIDLEGLVLHIVWPRDPRCQRRDIQRWQNLVSRAKASDVSSGLLQLTWNLLERIAKAADISCEDVLEYITGQNQAWDFNDIAGQRTGVTEANWERDLASLDTVILSLLNVDIAASDIGQKLEEELQGSLFSRQIARREANIQSMIRKFLAIRADLIWSCTSPAQRKGYYMAGLDLRGGRYLDEHLSQLVEKLLFIEEALESGNEFGIAHAAVEIAEIMFQTAPFRPSKLPANWRDTLFAWIMGMPLADIISFSGDGAVDFLQEGVSYRLAWAMEAARVHALAVGQTSAVQLKGSAAWAIEVGCANLAAITLLKSGLDSRETAMIAVRSTAARFKNRAEMSDWLRSTEIQHLNSNEKWPSESGRPAWRRFIDSTTRGDRMRWTEEKQVLNVEWLQSKSPPMPGDHVIVEQDEGEEGWVFQPDYTKLGRLLSRLQRPRKQILEARVGEQPGIIEITFFGPQIAL
jgi:superfamily II DNA/RNA helicase